MSLDDKRSDSSSNIANDFERHLFSAVDDSSNSNSFFRKFDYIEKTYGKSNSRFHMNDSGQSQL